MEKVDTILFEITSLKFFLDFYVKFISNIKNGGSIKSAHGMLWKVNKDVVVINPKIKNYLITI